MTRKEGVLKRVRISERKLQILIRCFVTDTNISHSSKIVLLNRNTCNRYFNFFRELLVDDQICEKVAIDIFGGIEVDELYIGARRIRGRGAAGIIIIFK